LAYVRVEKFFWVSWGKINLRQQKSGISYDLEGNKVSQDSEESHIPAHLFKVYWKVTQ
jgi:hypothetical protein